MIFGVVTMSTAVLLMGFAPAYWVLLPLAALGARQRRLPSGRPFDPLRESAPGRLGRAFGIHGFGGNCGYFISPIIVYYGVTSVVGWRMGLIVAGLIGLSAALLIWRYRSVLAMPRRDPNFGEERGGKADIGFYRDLVTSAPLMSAFFYFVMVAAALAGVQGFTVTALVEQFDTPLHLAAAGVTAYFFGGAVGILLGGEIADRFRYPAFIASGGLAIAAVLMSTIGLFDMSITMIIGIMCSVGFWSGITQPSRDILVKGAAPERASGKTFGFVYSGLDLGGAVAPLYFGYLMDGGFYNEVFLVIGGLYALAIFTILQLRRQRAQLAVVLLKPISRSITTTSFGRSKFSGVVSPRVRLRPMVLKKSSSPAGPMTQSCTRSSSVSLKISCTTSGPRKHAVPGTFVSFAIDEHIALAGETYLQLDLVGMRMGADLAVRRDGLIPHRKAVELCEFRKELGTE